MGDCGTWVLTQDQSMLYGMIIAHSKAKRLSYLVPANAIFKDIAQKWKLGLQTATMDRDISRSAAYLRDHSATYGRANTNQERPRYSVLSPPVTGKLSPLAQRFVLLPLNDFRQALEFIQANPHIMSEPMENFIEEAILQMQSASSNAALRCIQQVLLLRTCRKQPSERADFLKGLIRKDENIIKDFFSQRDRVMERVEEQAKHLVGYRAPPSEHFLESDMAGLSISETAERLEPRKDHGDYKYGRHQP